MAELLVRVVDKTNPNDPVVDAHLLKRGDVVAVCPDGHPWSERERSAEYWQIVRVAGVSVATLLHLVAEDVSRDPGRSRRRVVSLDLDRVRSEKRLALASGLNAPHLDMSLSEVRAIETERPRRAGGVVEL